MSTQAIKFGVQAHLISGTGWLDLARKVEDLGYDSLTVAHHPGTCASPFVALGAAAAVTETIRLGPYVANAGLCNAFDLASDVATLDVLSQGRAFLGLGAGHTPDEWSQRGLVRPSAGDRITHMIETAEAVQALLAGDVVNATGKFVTLVDAELDNPRPVQKQVPLLIGGNNTRLLQFAGRSADVVGLTGLGKTLEGGHRHEIKWGSSDLTRTVGLIGAAASGRSERPELQALVQAVGITENAMAFAKERFSGVSAPLEVMLASPFVLIGTLDEIAERVESNRTKWGITSYMIREANVDDLAPLVSALSAN